MTLAKEKRALRLRIQLINCVTGTQVKFNQMSLGLQRASDSATLNPTQSRTPPTRSRVNW